MKLAATAPMGGKILTRPFVFLSLLVLIALVLLGFRFVYGLGAATNLNNGYPWGFGSCWISTSRRPSVVADTSWPWSFTS